MWIVEPDERMSERSCLWSTVHNHELSGHARTSENDRTNERGGQRTVCPSPALCRACPSEPDIETAQLAIPCPPPTCHSNQFQIHPSICEVETLTPAERASTHRRQSVLRHTTLCAVSCCAVLCRPVSLFFQAVSNVCVRMTGLA